MVMNFYMLVLISLPEAFLNLIIFLLFAGAKANLKINRRNVLRFTISLFAMLVSTSIIRPHITNVVVSILLHCTIYIIIIILVYRLKVIYAALSVAFTMLIFSSVENLYYPFIIAYISKGIDNYMKQYRLIAIYALPTRVFQMIIIWCLWKFEIILITRISRRFHKVFVFLIFILIFVEYFFAYAFSIYFNIYTLVHQLIYAFALVLMVVVVNLLIFQTVYIAIGDVLTKGYSKYKELEDDAKLAFDIIDELISSNRSTEAIKLIKELKGSDKLNDGGGER